MWGSKTSTLPAQSIWPALQRSTAIVELSPDAHVLSANNHFSDIFGYSLQELQGQPHSLLCDPEYAASPAYQAFWQRLRSGEFVQGEFQRRHRDGQLIWLQASYNPILDSAGKVIRVIKLAYEITEKTEQAQRASAILQAIERSMAVIEFDLQGYVLRANDNFLRTMAWRSEALVGQHHRALCRSDYAASPAYAAFWDDLRAGRYFSGKVERVDHNGRIVWLEATYNPVSDPNGVLTHVIKIASDITDRVRVSEARQHGVDTAFKVAQETRELSEQGAQTILDTTQRIHSIAQLFQTTAEQVQQLGHRTQSITSSVNGIRRVADQTNLLALNAAVEAARAGQAGNGFAVVAAEVRKLAADSRNTTGEIHQIIQAVQQQVADMAAHIQAGLSTMDEGVQLSGQAKESIQRIRTDAHKVVDVMQELYALDGNSAA